ncbi:MAG: tetratricopeptide repeat protein [Deltaproteobacteria bacterium]|nr:tetratricopeptide repeat protein [Deltaproteobacteria bacterium]
MAFFQKFLLVLLVWVLTIPAGSNELLGASSNTKPKTTREVPVVETKIKQVPGVETKIKQVPGERAFTVPLWKVHWEKARQLVLQKKYSEAVPDFRQALALKPNLDEARLELAQVLVTLERWGEAIIELDAVVEHQPLNQKVQKDLADLLSQKKEYRRAIERYQWLLQREPDNIQVRLSLASNYYQINELEKALIEWRQVLIRDPQQVEARTHLAEVLGATRRLDESIILLEGLVKQFPKQSSLKKKLAQNLILAQKNKEALPYLQELNRQDPGDPEIQLWLAKVLSAGKQYDQSLTYLDAYLKKKPDQTSALLEKARALFFTGNHLQAMELYERIRKTEPKNIELQREIAEAYFSSGNNKEALAEYESLAKQFPDEYPLHEKIGELYFQNKKFSQAIAPFQKALSLEPENSVAQLNLARAFSFSPEKLKALPLYRSILSKRNDLKIQIEMADLLFDIQQFPETFSIFQQILKEQPELWEVRFKLATGLYRQEEFTPAAQQLEILVQMRPDHPGILILAGNNALEQGDYPQAQKAFQKVLTLGEDQANTLLRLGQISRFQGRPWKGLSYLDWALTVKPGDQEILIEKAKALTDGGGWSQARRILEPMIQDHPQSFKIQRAWAWFLAALDRRDECEAVWEKLENRFPQEQDLIFSDRADFYLRQKKPGLALTALKAAQIKNPKNLDFQRRIGRLLLQMERWQEAESFYRDLEHNKILLKEDYWAQALLLIRRGKKDLAREQLWKALLQAPDSVKARFWLWRVLNMGVGELKKIEEALWIFARSQEGGLLELAEGFQEIGDREKAYACYRELIEKGEEDDDVLWAVIRIPDSLPVGVKSAALQEMLEDMQKRFPRNQMLTRRLIDHYRREKEYGLAIKAIDGLLKVEDPLDPILTLYKARLLERWNKHWDSQSTYRKLLDPLMDSLFREKVNELFSKQDIAKEGFLKKITGTERTFFVNQFYEETKRKIEFLSLEPILKKKLESLLDDFKVRALIQKKVFLEKEEKDYLWRGLFFQARPLLEELKEIDSDNEEVPPDIDRAYRSQN